MSNDELLAPLITEVQNKLNAALASMVQKEAQLEIKNSGQVSLAEVHNLVDDANLSITTVYIPIMGDVTGDIFLFLVGQSAHHLADLLTGNALGTCKVLGEFEQSALKELGNITTGVIVTELANRLGLSMMLTTPNLATDMAGALVDQVLIQYGETSNDLLAIRVTFEIQEAEANGSFLLLFDQETSSLIKTKL